jgi:hypothetical protein
MSVINHKFSILISFLVALVAVWCAYGLQTRAVTKIKGATISSRIYELKADGSVVELGTQTTYISAHGNWRTVKTSPDGRVEQILVADASRGGVFSINGNKQEALKLAPFTPKDSSYLDAEGYRSHPQFAGEETILGFRGFIQRLTGPGGEIETELTYVAEFDVLPFKQVHYLSDGGKKIIEPVSVEVNEPADHLFRLPSNISVKDALLNQKNKQN